MTERETKLPAALVAIEKWNLLLGMVLSAASLSLTSGRFALGVVVGVLLTCLNFWGMSRLIGAILRTTGRARVILQLLLGAKMALLLGAIWLVMSYLPLDPIGLTVGLSVLFLSITVETVRSALCPATPSTSSDEASQGD